MVVPLFVIILYSLITGITISPDDFMLYYVIPLSLISIPLGGYNMWLYYKQAKKARTRPQEFVGNVRTVDNP